MTARKLLAVPCAAAVLALSGCATSGTAPRPLEDTHEISILCGDEDRGPLYEDPTCKYLNAVPIGVWVKLVYSFAPDSWVKITEKNPDGLRLTAVTTDNQLRGAVFTRPIDTVKAG